MKRWLWSGAYAGLAVFLLAFVTQSKTEALEVLLSAAGWRFSLEVGVGQVFILWAGFLAVCLASGALVAGALWPALRRRVRAA